MHACSQVPDLAVLSAAWRRASLGLRMGCRSGSCHPSQSPRPASQGMLPGPSIPCISLGFIACHAGACSLTTDSLLLWQARGCLYLAHRPINGRHACCMLGQAKWRQPRPVACGGAGRKRPTGETRIAGPCPGRCLAPKAGAVAQEHRGPAGGGAGGRGGAPGRARRRAPGGHMPRLARARSGGHAGPAAVAVPAPGAEAVTTRHPKP